MKIITHLRPRLTPLNLWFGGLATLVVAGLAGAAVVFSQGLVVTNLTDLVPWGLWITVDLSAIALSAGAFSLCAGVYLLGLNDYRPLARTATFIGLIGYSMAVMTLLLDVGRPDRFWHPIVFWNPHSVLWEVTMCVVLYLGVLLMEALPLFGAAGWLRSRWPGLGERMRSVDQLAPYLAVAGLFLSLLHQSSLGAAYGVLKSRPIWYRPGISVLFVVSAIAGGLSLTGLATMIVGRLSRKIVVDDAKVAALAKYVGWVLVAYLYFRFWDAFAMTYTTQPGRDEGLRLLVSGPLSFNFWFLELLLGGLVPAVLLLRADSRRQAAIRMVALALVVGGVVAYRWDTTLVGQMVVLTYLPNNPVTAFASYAPSFVEFVTAAGVVAYGLLAFTLGVRHLRVVDHSDDSHEAPAAVPRPAWMETGAD